MARHKLRSRGPVRRETLLVGNWTDGLAGDRILLRETREIVWLRQSETQVKLFWDDRPFDEKSTLSDHYGFLRDAQDDEPQRYAAKLALTLEDRLEVRALTTVYDSAVRELPPDPHLRGWPTEYEVLDLLMGTEEEFEMLEKFDWNAEIEEGGWTPFQMKLIDRRVVGEHIVYSSKLTDEENARNLAETLALYGVVPQGS